MKKSINKQMEDLRASILVDKIEKILDYEIPNSDKVPIIMEKIKIWRSKWKTKKWNINVLSVKKKKNQMIVY